MPRKERNRFVAEPPRYRTFKPAGVMGRDLVTLPLSLDELEAVKLADLMELDHQEAATQMQISRSTFSRLVARARAKTADALINGKALVIGGGAIHFRNNIFTCPSCGHRFVTPINEELDRCPSCGNTNLTDLAGSFGHGRCCRHGQRERGRRCQD